MRCAALFGGRPERGAAGLANDVRRSHVLIGDSCGVSAERVLCTFFWCGLGAASRKKDDAKPRPTTRTDRLRPFLRTDH